jgi:lysophospholipase L1-like esterase
MNMQNLIKKGKYLILILLNALAFTLTSCKKDDSTPVPPPIPPKVNLKNYTYLALGDSYMESNPSGYGTRSSFPFKLTDTLKKQGVKVQETVVAQFGWTTSNLISGMKSELADNKTFDLITLCIGVNDNYQKNDTSTYRQQFKKTLALCLERSANQPKHIFVLSVPDWGVTPFAKGDSRTPEQIAIEINAMNAINYDEAVKAKVNYIDITTISRQAKTDTSLISSDQLHPSEKMNIQWAKAVYPFVYPVFQ